MKLDIRLASMLNTGAPNPARALAAKPDNADVPLTSFGALLATRAGADTELFPGTDAPALSANTLLPEAPAAADMSTELTSSIAPGADQSGSVVGLADAELPVSLVTADVLSSGQSSSAAAPLSAEAIQPAEPTDDAMTAAQAYGAVGLAVITGVVAPVAAANGTAGVSALRSSPWAAGTAAAGPTLAQRSSEATEPGTTAAPALPLPSPVVSATDTSFALADYELAQSEISGRAVSHDTAPHDSALSAVQNNHGSGRISALPGAVTASLASPLATPQWQQEFSQQMVTLVQRGTERVSLHLNPAELGPLVVDMEISEQHALLQFASAHAQVRSALEQALPQLRDALAEQGISLGETHIGNERGREQQTFASRGNAAEAADTLRADDRPRSSPGTLNRVLQSDGRVNLYV